MLLSSCVSVGAVLTLWLALLVPYKGGVSQAPINDISQKLNTAFASTANGAASMPTGRHLLF